MKRLMKKISGLLVIAFLISAMTFPVGVSATTNTLLTEGQIGLLQHLSIVPAQLPDMNHALTRGELAHMAAKLANMPEYTGEGDFFYDVLKDHPYRGDICALAQAGILHGDGDGYFRPDEKISQLEICKVFSVILGYDPIGKFDSYIRIAREAGVSDGLNADGVVTYGEAMLLAHNTLHCEMMEVVAYGNNNTYKVTQGYRAIERYHGLVKQEGVVEGIPHTTLTGPTINISEKHIMINDRQFEWEDESVLGKYVIFYSKRTKNETSKKIEYLYAHEGRNKIFTLQGEDVSKLSATELKYFVNEKEKSVRITGRTDVVINGVADVNYTEADLKKPMAKITLIDNNDDTIYDVIMVEDPTFLIVGGVDSKNNMIYGKYPQITVGSSQREVDLAVSMTRGKTLLSMVPVGTPLAIFESKNTTGTLKIRANQVSGQVQGQVERFMNDKITVAGKEYKMTGSTVVDETVRLGDTVTLYPYGGYAAIILHADSDDYQFAYLVGARNSGGAFSGKVAVKLVGSDRVLHEFDATNPLWVDEIKYTKADAVLERLMTAAQSRVFVTGTSEVVLKENERIPYSQPIRYKLNSEGLLTHIDTVIYEKDYEQEKSLRPLGEIKNMYYGSGSQSFYNGSASTSDFVFTAPFDAKNIIMPPQEKREEVEWYQSGYPVDGRMYLVEAYTIDPENHVAEYMIAYNPKSETGDGSAIGLVANIYQSLNEDGEVETVADMYNPRTTKTVILSEKAASEWEIGDVLLYETDSTNHLAEGDTAWRYMFDYSLGKNQDRVKFAYSTSPTYKPSYYNTYSNIRTSYGTVLSYKDSIITHVNAVTEDEEGITNNGLQNYKDNGVAVYVYEKINGSPRISTGSMADVMPYNMDPTSGQKTLIGTRSSGRLEYIVVYK